MHESEKWKWSCSVVSDPQRPHGLQPSRLLHPWDFPGKSTGVGCHCLLWEYTEELYKKDLNDPDNHDGVITYLEPDILEYEIKWVLGNITMNKASGGDGILAELFQILKDDAVKVLHSICQKIWNTQQWPQWKVAATAVCYASRDLQRRGFPSGDRDQAWPLELLV